MLPRKFLVILCVLAAAGCGASGTGGRGGGSNGDLRLGLIVDKTGLLASSSEDYIKGVNTAVKQWNSQPGVRKVTVEQCDSLSTGEGAVSCYRSLAPKVDAFLGPSQALGMNAIKPVASRQLPPVVSVMPVTFPAADSSIFQTLATIPDAVNAGLQGLKARGLTKIAVLASSDAPGKSALAAVKADAPKQAVSVVSSQTFEPSAANVTPQAQEIASKRPDAVILWTTSPTVVNAIAGLHAAQLGVPVFMSYTSMRASFMEAVDKAGTAPKGGLFFIGSTAFAPSDISDASWQQRVQQFDKLYQASYHEPPSIGALDNADTVFVAAQAAAKSTSPASIKDALQNNASFNGILFQHLRFTRADHIGAGAQDLSLLHWNATSSQFALAR